MNYKSINENIQQHGFAHIPVSALYSEKEFAALTKFASGGGKISNVDLIRNFGHVNYKLAVTEKVKEFVKQMAWARINLGEGPTLVQSQVRDENIQISYAQKGPSFGNGAMSSNAFHYDDCFICMVIPFQLPESEPGAGLMIYKNLKFQLGMGFLSKLISRLLGRISVLRLVVKPHLVQYELGKCTLFFGDISLHGVGACLTGDRISVAVNLSQMSIEEFSDKYRPTYLSS